MKKKYWEVKIINKVLTALGNPKINKDLRKKFLNIVSNDIQYQEGILEFLEKDKKIDYLIIEKNLPGNFKINELIYNIKRINNKIRIILISDEEENIHVYKVLKKQEIEKSIDIIKNKSIFFKRDINTYNTLNEKEKEAEVISILGTNGIGKSVFSVLFASQINHKKTLIMDFNILNKNIYPLLVKKSENYNINDNKVNSFDFHNYIIHSKNNIDFISGTSLIFSSKKQSSNTKIRNIIIKLKKEYDLIILDTSSESLLDYTKEFIRISDNSIFISGANILEIKKSIRILEIYHNEWKVSYRKVSIIFNKCTNQSVDDDILKKFFKNYNILGKIQLSEYYDLAINKNDYNIKKIKKEILSIKNKYNSVRNKKIKIKQINKKGIKYGIKQ